MATKPTLPTLQNTGNVSSQIGVINDAFRGIENEFEKMVGREDNSLPNHMLDALDMNGHKVINVADGTTGPDAVNLSQLNTKEDGLGNPNADGQVLASTVAGDRYWVGQNVGIGGAGATLWGDIGGNIANQLDLIALVDGIPDSDLERFLYRDIGDDKYNAKDFQVKNLASGENTTDAVNLGQMLEAISIGGGTNPDVDNPVTGNRINTQYGATYTLQPLDADGTVEMTSSSPNTVFIPAYNPLNAITEGKQFLMHQRGIGKMSIAPETGAVILRYNEKLLPNADGRFSTIWAQYRGNNEWHVGGELELPVTPPTPPVDPTPQPIPTIAVPTGNFRSSKKVTFKTDGDVTIIDNSNTETSIGRWFPDGVPTPSPASYDIFCTMIAGDMENNQSSSKNTWLSLGSDRVWVAEDSTSVRWLELRITVRVIATGVTATNTITVSRRA